MVRQAYHQRILSYFAIALSGLPAVRARPPNHAPPLNSTLGGDLLATVEAAAAVIVVVLEVLGHQFQAVFAASHLVRSSV